MSLEAGYQSAAELCLHLIMIMPEQNDRIRYVHDFCAMYEMKEKSPPHLRPEEGTDKLGRIAGSK